MAGLRVVQLVPGVGPGTAQRVLEAMDASTRPWSALDAFKVPAAAALPWGALLELTRSLGADEVPWPSALERAIAWYRPHLYDRHEDAAPREGDLLQLLRLAAAYDRCETFLADLTLDPPQATSDDSGPPLLDEDYLVLSTIHAAKGQEWSSVFVLNVVDGCMPSDLATGHAEQIEEERRLLYVAMTRARRHLHLLVPQRFHVTQQRALGGRHLYASRSRFISDALLERFEQVQPRAQPTPALTEDGAGAPVDLTARVRDRWA
jgi:DNA helicase-2/ATP-dependent DNA helicase PcrA